MCDVREGVSEETLLSSARTYASEPVPGRWYKTHSGSEAKKRGSVWKTEDFILQNEGECPEMKQGPLLGKVFQEREQHKQSLRTQKGITATSCGP